MPWEVVDVEIQEEEATVNLLRREHSSALYKVEELARIVSDGSEQVECLKTSTAVSSGGISLSVFNEIFIFDVEQSSYVSSISLDNNVEVMAWCPDSKFLVICDTSGNIHFFSYALGDVVYTTSLKEKTVGKETCFAHCFFASSSESEGMVNLTILSCDGCIFFFKDLPLRELSNKLEAKDIASINALKENIIMETFSVTDVHFYTNFCAQKDRSLIVAGKGEYPVSVWMDNHLTDVIETGCFHNNMIKKCDVTADGKYLLILDEACILSVFDAETLIMLSTPCDGVKDFVLTIGSTSAMGSGQVVVLSETVDGKSKIQVFVLPGFAEIYCKQLTDNCSLAYSKNQENVYYVEECDVRCNNNVLKGLALKCLSEASPEHRVYSLVRKKKFDVALQFSKAFGLDPEFVHKAKASIILAAVSVGVSASNPVPEERVVSVESLIDDLEVVLKCVRSVEFITECCLSACPPRLRQVHRLLSIAKDQIEKVAAKEKNKYLKEMNSVLLSLNRLETFQLVFGDSNFSPFIWRSFSRGDMLSKVTQALSQGRMSSAAIIWLRHHTEFEKDFSSEKLQSILASLRSDMPSSLIVSWLKQYFIPFVIRTINDRNILYILASWLEKSVATLEISEVEYWPLNGIAMATVLFDVSEENDATNSYSSYPTSVVVSQDYGCGLVRVSMKDSQSNPVSSLAKLVENLKELKKLHVNYQCKLPLAELTKKTPIEIMFKMLDCVLVVSMIPNVINNQITQYGLSHNLNIEEVLVQYISHKVKNIYSSSSSNTLHEDRFVEITRSLRSRPKRLEAILMLMSWASVPWCTTIEEMVNTAIKEDPSNSDLTMGYRLMEMKKILKLYGIRDFELSSNLHLKNVIRYILSTSRETALQDSLRIVEIYQCMSKEDVYVIRLRNLCLKGLSNECAVLLDAVDESNVLCVAQYFLQWVILAVDVYEENQHDRQERNLIIDAGVQTIEFLNNTGHAIDDLRTIHEALKSIQALEKEFSVFISYCDYNNVEHRNVVLDAYLKTSGISLIDVYNDSNLRDKDKVLRLAELFGLSLAQLQFKMLHHASNLAANSNLNFSKWLTFCMSEISCDERMTLCRMLLDYLVSARESNRKETDSDFAQVLYGIVCHAVSYEDVFRLKELLDLSKLFWLTKVFHNSCDSGDLCLSSSVCDEDLEFMWKKGSRFQDNGFVLDFGTSLPLFRNFAKAVLLLSESPLEHSWDLVDACGRLILHLEENNLHELALQCTLFSLRLVLESVPLKDLLENTMLDGKMITLRDVVLNGLKCIPPKLLQFLSKMLHSNNVDQSLVFGFLNSIPEEQALELVKRDFSVEDGHEPCRAAAVFSVFLDFAKGFCGDDVLNAAQNFYSDALWVARLKHLEICDDNLFLTGENRDVKNILKLLLEKPGVEVDLIVEFCELYSIDVTGALHTYVSCNLTTQFSCHHSNTLGSPQTSKIGIYEDNLVKAVEYLLKQSSISELLTLLRDVLHSLPMYDYERISIVLNQMAKVSRSDEMEALERQLEVVNLLTNHTRISAPSEYEENFKATNTGHEGKEDASLWRKIASKRLPFHPLFYGKPWKIISPELAEETIPKLLRLCQILKMQEDHVYVTAAQNMVSASLKKTSCVEDASSECSSVANARFERAIKLLSRVSNCEFAVKTALTLLSKWPQCEERVKAAKFIVNIVSSWRNHCDEGQQLQLADKILKTSKDMCQEISIQQILQANGVTDEISFSLKGKPIKLIFHLYEAYGCVSNDQRPNIHEIANEVAETSDIKIAKVRNRLLAEWQPSTSSHGVRSLTKCAGDDVSKDRSNMQRVIYLLQADSLQKNTLFLLNFAYRQGPSKITYESRVRAIKLLFNIASEEMIESVAKISIADLRSFMKSLVYLSELENLHLNQTVESFQRCNKEGLVKGLWKNHKNNGNAVLLIADICLDSKIAEPQIWTNILRQLVNLGLTSYMVNLLPRLIQFPSLWLSSNLVKVWTDFTMTSLLKAVSPLSADDNVYCRSLLQLLQKCPVMIDALSKSLFDKLLELGMLSDALACLTLLPGDIHMDGVSKLMSLTTPENILVLLSDEEKSRPSFVDSNVSRRLLFEFLDSSELYNALQDPEHCLKFADYLMSKRKLPKMIMAVMKSGRLDTALSLARYYDMHGSPLTMKTFRFDGGYVPETGLNELVVFLKKHSIFEEALPFLPELPKTTPFEEMPQLENASDSNIIPDIDFLDVF